MISRGCSKGWISGFHLCRKVGSPFFSDGIQVHELDSSIVARLWWRLVPQFCSRDIVKGVHCFKSFSMNTMLLPRFRWRFVHKLAVRLVITVMSRYGRVILGLMALLDMKSGCLDSRKRGWGIVTAKEGDVAVWAFDLHRRWFVCGFDFGAATFNAFAVRGVLSGVPGRCRRIVAVCCIIGRGSRAAATR